MAGTIRIGDCLMLSQTSWKCGRAFAGGKNGPSEFKEVELELARLAKSLKLLAECLFAEDTEILLSLAEGFTRAGIAMIIEYCKHTLTNLESLMEQYQTIKKTPGSHGFSIEKGWSNVVLSTYKDLIWTIDGGNIYILRDMLHMHVSTTAVIRQALERSVVHLILDALGLIRSQVNPAIELNGRCPQLLNGFKRCMRNTTATLARGSKESSA